jgi:Trk K+ transport system NAD-binding subunit
MTAPDHATKPLEKYLARTGASIHDDNRSRQPLRGATIAEIERIGPGKVLVVALEKSGGETILQPPDATIVKAGDGLAVIHRPGRTETLEGLIATEVAMAK